jgi:hypothetical protein
MRVYVHATVEKNFAVDLPGDPSLADWTRADQVVAQRFLTAITEDDLTTSVWNYDEPDDDQDLPDGVALVVRPASAQEVQRLHRAQLE